MQGGSRDETRLETCGLRIQTHASTSTNVEIKKRGLGSTWSGNLWIRHSDTQCRLYHKSKDLESNSQIVDRRSLIILSVQWRVMLIP